MITYYYPDVVKQSELIWVADANFVLSFCAKYMHKTFRSFYTMMQQVTGDIWETTSFVCDTDRSWPHVLSTYTERFPD